MNTSPTPHPRLAYLKGFLWFAFGGTAMVSAFTLPLHISISWLDLGAFAEPKHLVMRSYFFIVTVCALYHGLYRTVTLLEDLGVKRAIHVIEWTVAGVGMTTMLMAGWLIFFAA